MPGHWQNSTDLMTLDPHTFDIVTNANGCDVIENGILRYKRLLVLDPDGVIDPDLTTISRLAMTIENVTCGHDYYPHADMDESCMCLLKLLLVL